MIWSESCKHPTFVWKYFLALIWYNRNSIFTFQLHGPYILPKTFLVKVKMIEETQNNLYTWIHTCKSNRQITCLFKLYKRYEHDIYFTWKYHLTAVFKECMQFHVKRHSSCGSRISILRSTQKKHCHTRLEPNHNLKQTERRKGERKKETMKKTLQTDTF